MKIAMANDHAGTRLKEEIKAYLEQEWHEVKDFGTYDEEGCDLSDFVYPAALAVADGTCDRGIFVDGVGYGSAMIANKLSGIYACVCQDPFVLCIGGKIIGSAIAMEIVKTWMHTDALTAEKYVRRRDKVAEINNKHCVPVR